VPVRHPILAARRTRIVASPAPSPARTPTRSRSRRTTARRSSSARPRPPTSLARWAHSLRGAAWPRSLCGSDQPLTSSAAALPRQLYEERIREEIDRLIETRHAARFIDQRSSFLDDDLALVHFFCGSEADLDLPRLGALEGEIAAIVERWEDRFEAALVVDQPSDRALRLADAYADAFPESYRVTTSAAEAVLDVRHPSACRARRRSSWARLRHRLRRRAPTAEDLPARAALPTELLSVCTSSACA
jgi:hypothetical protein